MCRNQCIISAALPSVNSVRNQESKKFSTSRRAEARKTVDGTGSEQVEAKKRYMYTFMDVGNKNLCRKGKELPMSNFELSNTRHCYFGSMDFGYALKVAGTDVTYVYIKHSQELTCSTTE